MLEFFRPDHGHEQINKQQEGDNADDDGFHLYSYSFSQSSVYSAPATKNADHYSYEDQVTHTRKYQRDLMRRLIKPWAKMC